MKPSPTQFKPGDEVVVTHTGATGVVTYPGPRGIPSRVYVIHRMADGRSLTIHHHFSELEMAAQ